jgi:cytochrome P450
MPGIGHDVDTYRPERWLEADPAKLRDMNPAMLHFGAGSRACLGRHISVLEIYKSVTSLLRRFDVSTTMSVDFR